MKTLTKEMQNAITPAMGIELLKEGNKRFVSNLKINRNLLQQVNETAKEQNPFAVIISCMDSRTSAELIFDQGLGDIFSIRVAGNVINEDILASAEFGCKVAKAKVVMILGHTGCGAIKGSIADVDLGHLHFITRKVQRCFSQIRKEHPNILTEDFEDKVTHKNVIQGIEDLKNSSTILADLLYKKEIAIIGGIYNLSSGVVEFFEE